MPPLWQRVSRYSILITILEDYGSLTALAEGLELVAFPPNSGHISMPPEFDIERIVF